MKLLSRALWRPRPQGTQEADAAPAATPSRQVDKDLKPARTEPGPATPLPPMTVEDVAWCYCLFLGREAENEAVLEERALQAPSDIIVSFVGCDEFDTWLRAVSEADGAVSSLFRAPPSHHLVAWAAGLFAPTEAESEALERARTVLALLAEVLLLPTVWAALVRQHGREGADERSARVRHSAARIPPIRSAELEGVGTSVGDVRNLYLLLHNRLPESEAVDVARPRATVLDCTVEFMASREFATHIVPAALNRQLGGRGPLAGVLATWVRATFGVTLSEGADRQEAVAAILKLPIIRERLLAEPLVWSVDGVAEALDRQPHHELVGAEAPATASFRQLLQASGLFDADWYLTRYSDLKRLGVDALSHFVLFGASEGRDPGPGFETAFYLEQDAEVARSGLNPLEHYLRVGCTAGLLPRGLAPYERWLTRFSDLTSTDRARIEAAATRQPLPTVVCLHLARGDTPEQLGRVRAAVADQVGTNPLLRVVGNGEGMVSASTSLDGVPDEAVLVLTADAAVLRPEAAYSFACALAEMPARIAYADHDHLRPDGERADPVFKPAMSPDFMRRLPYAGPVAALVLAGIGRTLVADAIVAAVTGDPAAAFASLFLAPPPDEVARVPIPLFGLPLPDGGAGISVRLGHEPEGGDPAIATDMPDDPPRVCILIPTRNRVELLQACVDSILADTAYPRDRLELLVIDNDSHEPATLEYLGRFAQAESCRVVRSPGAFNFSKICNDGAAATDASMLVFLNNDTTVRDPGWLAALVAEALRPEIGVVGAQLLYPDDTVQHGGVVMGLGGVGGHRLIGLPVAEVATRDVTREMVAVTGACFALRRSVFDEVGGFDEALAVAFNDVALCARIFQAGYRNLYLARPLIYHHESKSRGYDDTEEKVARNAREAIYARERFPMLFQDDPSYSPNLSLVEVGTLAMPPRLVRPWRRDPARRCVFIVASVHGLGHGVAGVVAMQAARFLARGWKVLIGGPIGADDRPYPGCTRIHVAGAVDAAAVAVAEGVDLVVAHTPPFFSMVLHLGAKPIVYAYDHGEPPPELFADDRVRRGIDLDKRLAFSTVNRLLAISQAIRDEQFAPQVTVLRNGNSHLAAWSPQWEERREALRRRFGFEGRFVVLNVCRFRRAERLYKGVDDYAKLAAELAHAAPETAGRTLFALAGQGDEEDVAVVRASGLTVFANVSDQELAELYAASDFYVSLSRWEGYNLGIGQALAMGLEVVASDIPAHREFGVPTANALPNLVRLVADAFRRRERGGTVRLARLESWDKPLDRLVDMAEADLVGGEQHGAPAQTAPAAPSAFAEPRIERFDHALADLSREALRTQIEALNAQAELTGAVIFRPPGDHACVAVIFAGNAERFFMLAAARRLRCPVICLQDPASFWYQGSTVLPDLDRLVETVLVPEVGCARPLLFGQSSGAYAALAASTAFSGATVVACAPQTFSDGDLKQRIHFAGIRALAAPPGLIDLGRRLAARLDPATVRAAVIAAGEVDNPAHAHWWGDYLHLMRLADVPGVQLHIVNENTHVLAHRRTDRFAELLQTLAESIDREPEERSRIITMFLNEEFGVAAAASQG